MASANRLSTPLGIAAWHTGNAESEARPPLQLTAARAHLWQVFWARNVVLLVLGLWFAFVTAAFPSLPVAGLIGAAAVVNLATWLRLRQRGAVSQGELLLQILLDVVLISAGLHYAGDAAADIAVLSFVPLTIAAATLSWRQTLIVFLVVFGLHEVVCHFLPGFTWPDPTERRMELLAGGLIACFVYSMARTARLHEEQLARMREKYLEQRHAADLGVMAATAVHELSSPLGTLAVLVGELRTLAAPGAAQRRTLDVMAVQIESCKRINSRLLAWAGQGRAEGGGKVSADEFVARIVEKCRLMQPWIALEHRSKGPSPAPEVVGETALEQALLVLLHSQPGTLRQVAIEHEWDDTHLRIRMADHGPGEDGPDGDGLPGTPLFAAPHPPPAKELDLLMAKATIDRFGGRVEVCSAGKRVRCIELSLPLSRLRASPATTHDRD